MNNVGQNSYKHSTLWSPHDKCFESHGFVNVPLVGLFMINKNSKQPHTLMLSEVSQAKFRGNAKEKTNFEGVNYHTL